MHLSEDSTLALEALRSAPNERAFRTDLWQTQKLGTIPRVGVVIAGGMRLVLPRVALRSGDVCLLTLGPSRHLRADEVAGFAVYWQPDGLGDQPARPTKVFEASLRRLDAAEPWVDYRFSLDKAAGSTGAVLVVPRSRGWRFWQPTPDLVLYDCAIGGNETLDLERARSFRQLRIRNERINFDAYYQHAVFQLDTESAQQAGKIDEARAAGNPAPSVSPQVPSAFKYSEARLREKVGFAPPLFAQRLQSKIDALRASGSADSRARLRILSLCSGAARIEHSFVHYLPSELISLTLVDVNANLLAAAARKFAAWGGVETIVADVNELDLRGERYDLILCASALHHVVELEHVIGGVARAIGDTGEFWSIAETVTRNGGRMFPEPYAVANAWFQTLDDKYRFNRNTNTVDTRLPDVDCSIGCFEGIRCEAIEPTLARFLAPVHVFKYNCIVWKLFSLAYSDNYDMALEHDRRLVDAAVDLDVDLYRRGSYGIELQGVYRRR